MAYFESLYENFFSNKRYKIYNIDFFIQNVLLNNLYKLIVNLKRNELIINFKYQVRNACL